MSIEYLLNTTNPTANKLDMADSVSQSTIDATIEQIVNIRVAVDFIRLALFA